MRLDSATTREAFDTSDAEQQRHTRLLRRNSRDNDRRRSWIAGAYLDVPIQLVYVSDDGIGSSWSGSYAVEDELHGRDVESRAFGGGDAAIDLESTSSQCGGRENSLRTGTETGTTPVRGRKERLPTYRESTDRRSTSIVLWHLTPSHVSKCCKAVSVIFPFLQYQDSTRQDGS